MSEESIEILQLTLHERIVGYLTGFQHGKNILTFSDEFRDDTDRPTFTLTTHPSFPTANKILLEQWVQKHQLHPTLSNLLPEGALRELIAQELKIHVDNEFQIISNLGNDLPGAIMAKPVTQDEIPGYLLRPYGKNKIISTKNKKIINKFSLAGVQIKFSMKHKDGRYNLRNNDQLGDWIIKTPSTRHPFVPLNEYSAMQLAASVGIDVPENKLVEMSLLDNLPKINLPAEQYAFAIKRFDRNNESRIHMEDFAQVLFQYPREKYRAASYEQIAKILFAYSSEGMSDVQQFARRLLVNILLANGDAHLKNWSLIYRDQKSPKLSPAYDIVSTKVYMQDETEFALNMARNKNWYVADFSHFERWATKANLPWRAIKPHLEDTLQRARSIWPSALQDLPMHEQHKLELTKHWQNLSPDFRIN